jgi:hypothetical protein
MAWLCSVQLAKPPQEGLRLQEAQKALKSAMEKEKNSAYPILIYAWFVNKYREPGLRPLPTYRDAGTFEYKTADGKTHVGQNQVQVSDEAKVKRVKELLDKASLIDASNPLLQYLKAGYAKNEEDAKRLLWASIKGQNRCLWEYGALATLRRLAHGDKDELGRVRDRATEAQKADGNTALAKGHGF